MCLSVCVCGQNELFEQLDTFMIKQWLKINTLPILEIWRRSSKGDKKTVFPRSDQRGFPGRGEKRTSGLPCANYANMHGVSALLSILFKGHFIQMSYLYSTLKF